MFETGLKSVNFSKGASSLKRNSLKMSYDEHCTYENMASYAKGIKKWRKNWEKYNDNSKFPCEDPNNQNKSSNMKCCGYMGNLITENLEYVLLVMNYGIPGWVDYHSRQGQIVFMKIETFPESSRKILKLFRIRKKNPKTDSNRLSSF